MVHGTRPFIPDFSACPSLRPTTHLCRRARRQLLRASADDLDPIERAVGWLFGKKALEDRTPFGLKRMEGAALEQQYEANATDQAAAVEGDPSAIAIFRPVLAHTMLEKVTLREAYNAAQHGWSPPAFHQQVRNRGAAVVVAKTKSGTVLGGYNPVGWEGLGDQLDSRAAFLFVWPTGDVTEPAIKLPKVGGAGLALLDDPDKGPRFGAEGLTIPLTRDDPHAAHSRLGAFYQKMPDGSRSLFPEGKTAELTELQVYIEAE